MKILCIGRNYIDHAKELNNPVPKNPVLFIKPETALLRDNSAFYYPDFSKNIHYETEIVVRIDKLGKHIDEKFASRYYHQIAIGFDFTARDLQDEQKKKGLPWEIAKAFDQSAAISNFVELNDYPNIQDIHFSMEKNGELVQQGYTKDMIFSIDKIIAYISQFITLKIGDLIYTGTPLGVGPVAIGDKLVAAIEGKKILHCEIK